MTAAAAPSPRGKARGLKRWLTAGAVVAVLGAVTWAIVARWAPPPSHSQPPHAAAAAQTSADSRRIRARLFYLSDDGTELVESGREISYGATPVEQARMIVAAELEPPPAGLVSAIPAGTTVRAVFLTDRGDAYVDLSPEVVSGHTGGSLDEALTVFSIVNALTVNLPNVTGVQILVEGKAVDTLAGHIDLRAPLERSLKWVRKGQ